MGAEDVRGRTAKRPLHQFRRISMERVNDALKTLALYSTEQILGILGIACIAYASLIFLWRNPLLAVFLVV